MMRPASQAILLRVFISEHDYQGNRPLFECIVQKAREMGLAGATVLRGRMGFRQPPQGNAVKRMMYSHAVPVVVEIIDDELKIASFMPVLEGMLVSGCVTTQKVEVVQFDRHREVAK
jgi:uncharacterized protein